MASDVKDRILDAAVRLLIEHGGNALTQPKIAAAAGVRQSHLTYYFPKRDDLLLAITLHWARTHLATGAQEIGGRKATLRRATRYLTKTLLDAAPVRIILGLIIAADEDPRIRKPLRELVEFDRNALLSLLAAAGARLDWQAAALFHASLVGLAALRVARGDSADRETRQLVKFLMEQLLPAMTKTSRRGRVARASRNRS